IVGAFLVAVVAIVLFTWKGSSNSNANASDSDAAPSGTGSAGSGPLAPPVEITMLYSTEKKEWIEAAAIPFRKDHPEIKLTLNAKGSLAGAQAIVDEKEKPTIFSPADTLIMNLAAADWKTKGRDDLFAQSGDDAPQSLVITPLVFVIWEDRAQALLKAANGN